MPIIFHLGYHRSTIDLGANFFRLLLLLALNFFLLLTSSHCPNYLFHLPDSSTARLPNCLTQSLVPFNHSLCSTHPSQQKKMSSDKYHSWASSSFPPSSTPAPKSTLQLAFQNHHSAARRSSRSLNTLSRVRPPFPKIMNNEGGRIEQDDSPYPYASTQPPTRTPSGSLSEKVLPPFPSLSTL